MKKKRVARLASKNSFVKKNILNFFFVIVFANVFLGCTKYETWVSEIKIESTRVAEVEYTKADLVIVLSGDQWIADDFGFVLYGYVLYNFTYSWNYIGYNENRDMEWGIHLEGLLSGMTYQWQPYIQKNDIIVYGELQEFTTKY